MSGIENSDPLGGDSASWAELIELVGPASLLVAIESRMSSALRRMVSAEDIFQESLLLAWRDREKFEWRGVKSFRAWLMTIIENRIRDAADRAGSQKRGDGLHVASLSLPAFGGQGDSFGPAGTTTPSRVAVYREQAEVMKTALESLPEDLREVVRMRLFDQRQINEIAQELGLGDSAVRHRFRKGVELYYRRLRSELTSRSQSLTPESAALLRVNSSLDC